MDPIFRHGSLGIHQGAYEATARRGLLAQGEKESGTDQTKSELRRDERNQHILGVYTLPEAHRKRMRTTNMLERQNQELKRRTRVVRVFPHEQSCLRLVCALLMETNQEWMGRIYLRMEEEPVSATETQAVAA